MRRPFSISKRVFKALNYRLRGALRLPPRSDAETSYHLQRLQAKMPRFSRGEFLFSFGRLHFVDVLSLACQFDDIFMRRVYDFTANSYSPRIIDCGGNVGLSVIWFKQRYPQSKITVFEADPTIAQVLEQNLKSVRPDDVEIVKAAAWMAGGTVQFAPDGADGGRVCRSNYLREVPAVRLADLITGSVDLLKMDIEGAEFDVLADLCATGKIRQVRRLICEVHNRDANCLNVSELLTALSQNGFKICFSHARPAPDLTGQPQLTPFPAVADGRFLLELYAWQE